MGSKTSKRGKRRRKKAGSSNSGLDPAKVRRRLKMSVQEFAAALGVRDYTVERWERGESRPSPLAMSAIERLAEQKAP